MHPIVVSDIVSRHKALNICSLPWNSTMRVDKLYTKTSKAKTCDACGISKAPLIMPSCGFAFKFHHESGQNLVEHFQK